MHASCKCLDPERENMEIMKKGGMEMKAKVYLVRGFLELVDSESKQDGRDDINN